MSLTTTQKELLTMVRPDTKIIILDTETTGFRNSDKIIQFAGMKFVVQDDYTLVEDSHINVYINPSMPLSEEILKFNEENGTGITDAFLSDKPTEDQVYDEIITFLNDGLITGYNGGFDFRMMNNMAVRVGEIFDKEMAFDVMNLAKDFLKKPIDVPNHKLATVVSALNINADGFHSAFNDVIATARVLEVILKKYLEYIPPTYKNVKLLSARLSYNFLTKDSRKIVLKLSQGKDGDVYYDINIKEWVVKKSAPEDVFLPEIVKQFKQMYLQPFEYDTTEELANNWFNVMEKAKSKTKKK